MSKFEVRTRNSRVEVADASGRVVRAWRYSPAGRWVDTRRPWTSPGSALGSKTAQRMADRLNGGGIAREQALREAQARAEAGR